MEALDSIPGDRIDNKFCFLILFARETPDLHAVDLL